MKPKSMRDCFQEFDREWRRFKTLFLKEFFKLVAFAFAIFAIFTIIHLFFILFQGGK